MSLRDNINSQEGKSEDKRRQVTFISFLKDPKILENNNKKPKENDYENYGAFSILLFK
jgi:hypothetical protein